MTDALVEQVRVALPGPLEVVRTAQRRPGGRDRTGVRAGRRRDLRLLGRRNVQRGPERRRRRHPARVHPRRRNECPPAGARHPARSRGSGAAPVDGHDPPDRPRARQRPSLRLQRRPRAGRRARPADRLAGVGGRTGDVPATRPSSGRRSGCSPLAAVASRTPWRWTATAGRRSCSSRTATRTPMPGVSASGSRAGRRSISASTSWRRRASAPVTFRGSRSSCFAGRGRGRG